jgi:hypothetical protein
VIDGERMRGLRDAFDTQVKKVAIAWQLLPSRVQHAVESGEFSYERTVNESVAYSEWCKSVANQLAKLLNVVLVRSNFRTARAIRRYRP